MLSTGDDLLRKFWEAENWDVETPPLSLEKTVVKHFESSYCRNDEGRIIVPLPKIECVNSLRESRLAAVRQLFWLERSLQQKDKFKEFAMTMEEYFQQSHAEPVPRIHANTVFREIFECQILQ